MQLGGNASSDSGVGRWFLGALSVQPKVSGKPVVFKIDTGADITAISKSTFDSLQNQLKLHPSKASCSALGSLQQQ